MMSPLLCAAVTTFASASLCQAGGGGVEGTPATEVTRPNL